MSHQVFIDRCRDNSPEVAQGLANAIAQRYGIDPQQILGRLKKGRFRVKANLSIEKARQFVAYLEEQGALCSVEDASGKVVLRSGALQVAATLIATPAPSAPVKTPPPGVPMSTSQPAATMAGMGDAQPPAEDFGMSLMTPPPPEEPQETELTLEPAPQPPELEVANEPAAQAQEYESGLSAAFSSGGSQQELGALNEVGTESASFRLGTLDGVDEPEPEPEPEPAADAPSAAPNEHAADAFLPPEMQSEAALELAVEQPPAPEPEPEPEYSPPPSASGSMQAASAAVLSDEPYASEDGEASPEAKTPGVPLPKRLIAAVARNERVRFALGVALGVLIGFGVAHLVASGSEDSHYPKIQAQLIAEIAAADTLDRWEALDDTRASTLDALKARQKKIMIVGVLAWLVIAALIAFAWIRFLPWDRLAEAAGEAEAGA